jgi:cytochrome c2
MAFAGVKKDVACADFIAFPKTKQKMSDHLSLCGINTKG